MVARGWQRWAAAIGLTFTIASVGMTQGAKPKSAPKPAPKTAPATNQGEEPKPLEFGDTGPSFAMPESWPAPAARPAGSAEEAASVLAKAIYDGGAGALPAIQRAALESGLSIRNEAGGILFAAPQGADLGMAISDFELAVAAFLTHRRDPADLKLFNQLFAASPNLASMDLADLLAKSTSEFQGSVHPGKHFFGAFVRELGLESKGDFSIVFQGTFENKINGAQLAWLAYMAFGQMAVVRGKPPEISERIRSRGPFAFAVLNRQNSNAAIVSLSNMTTHMTNHAISQHYRQSFGAGNDLETVLLELVQNELIRAGMRMTGTMVNSPLVRTKQKGQVGGRSNLDIRLDFRIADRDRARFARAAQQLNAQAPLPPNGPLQGRSLSGSIDGNLVHIANVPQWMSQSAPGRFRIVLEGDAQTVQFSANAYPMAKEAEIFVAAHQNGFAEGPSVGRLFPIPVRDWMEPGIIIDYKIAAGGNGKIPGLGGAITEWSTHRYIEAVASLSFRVDVATLAGPDGKMSMETDRFTSWVSDPESDYGHLLNWDYEESIIRRMPPTGCDVADGSMDMLFSNATRRSDPAFDAMSGIYLKFAGYQEDRRLRTWDVQFATSLTVPVRVSASGRRPTDSTKALFSDITFDPEDARTLRILMPSSVWARPATATPGIQGGYVQYSASFRTRAKYALDSPGQKSIEVAGTVTITKSPNSGAPTESQVRGLVMGLLRRHSLRN